MPNHVTNILIIGGTREECDPIKAAISSVDEDGAPMIIDFNKIIPCPSSLNITSGTSTDLGVKCIKWMQGEGDPELDHMLEFKWVKDAGISDVKRLVEWLTKSGRADLEEGAIAIENEKKYGFRDWYSWNRENWGTKWNAYSQELREDGSIKFETAWSAPHPVIERLSQQWPGVSFILKWADEDFGHNVGEVTYLNGEVVESDWPKGGTLKAYEMAADIQGWEWIIDGCMGIEAEDESDFHEWEIACCDLVLKKGIIKKYPDVVLNRLERCAVENESYEIAAEIKRQRES